MAARCSVRGAQSFAEHDPVRLLWMRGHGAVIASGSIRQAVFVSVYLERTFIGQDAVGGDQLVDDVFQLGHILSLTPWLLSPRPR
jgi:hypothetical protein